MGFRKNLRRTLPALLLLPAVRALVSRWRYRYYVEWKGQLRTMAADEAIPVTVEHNLRSLTNHQNQRMETIFRPLSVIETLPPESRILVVGPRTECDLLNLYGYGFSPSNVRGLDLISYSPWIDLGDMHHMPYLENSWDAIILGWCLSYSEHPKKVAEEVIRVCRSGGLVAIGVEYSDLSVEGQEEAFGYSFSDPKDRINTTGEMLKLFGDCVETVFFDQDAPLKRAHTKAGLIPDPSPVVTIFSIRKDGSNRSVNG